MGCVKRGFGLALTGIATVAVMTASGSSGSQPDTEAAPTQPATNNDDPDVNDNGVNAAGVRFKPLRLRRERAPRLDDIRCGSRLGWQVIAGPGSLQFAALTDPTGSRTLMAAAATVPTGMQLAEWLAAMVRGTPSECSPPASEETTTLGGERAVVWTVKCSDGFEPRSAFPPCPALAGTSFIWAQPRRTTMPRIGRSSKDSASPSASPADLGPAQGTRPRPPAHGALMERCRCPRTSGGPVAERGVRRR